MLQSSVGDVNQPNQSSMAATVRVSHRHDSLDLMTALTDVMNGPHPWKCFHRLPEVLVFHVVHEQGGFPTAAEKKPFRFPPVFYPDRFMFDNAYEAQERIKQAESHAEAVQGLKTRRKALTELNVSLGALSCAELTRRAGPGHEERPARNTALLWRSRVG